MEYEGLFCKMRFDGTVFYYEATKSLSTALFWNRFNARVEIPISAIIDLKVSSYLPFSTGMIMRIRSGLHYEKVKTLTPMNITAVPDHVIEKLRQQVKKSNSQTRTRVG